MNEKYIEQKLVQQVKDIGGLALKFVSPSLDGVPDRILLFANARAWFVELKAPGKKLRPLQEKRKKQLEGLGFKVFVVDSLKKIEEVLNEISAS